jgi:hypothetical protein
LTQIVKLGKRKIIAYCFGINGVELPPGITASKLSQPPEKKIHYSEQE